MTRLARAARALAVGLALVFIVGFSSTRVLANRAAPDTSSILTVVRIAPAALFVEVGSVVTASIVISDVAGLYGAEVYLTFDPAVVSVVDAMPGQALTHGPLLTSQGPYFPAVNHANNATGVISYALSLFAAEPVTGTGVLAWARFQGISAGVTELAFNAVLLADIEGAPLSKSIENGRITVGRPYRAWMPLIAR